MDKQQNGRRTEDPLYIREWLSSLENERRQLIARLRHIDGVLVKYGRLKEETLPRRQR